MSQKLRLKSADNKMDHNELIAYLQEVLHNDGHVKNITYVVGDTVNDFADQYHLIEQTGAGIVAAIEAGAIPYNKWKINNGVAVLETTHEHHLDDDDDTFGVACITYLKPTPDGPKRYELRMVMMCAYV